MATTTPNFGWSVPTSSDLVKNGAVAIETLGDSIDASLVDLKGGTTGQVLAKASGTDMDFAWVSDATGMTNPMTTTGDVIYSSSGSTPARLGLGTAGQVLQVNSGATAPEWATPAGGTQSFTKIATSSFSAVATTSTTFDSVFTSTYKKYLVIMSEMISSTASTILYLQTRTAGATNTTSYYGASTSVNSAGTTRQELSSNAAQFSIARQADTLKSTYNFYFSNVGNASEKPGVSMQGLNNYDNGPISFGGIRDVASLVDGFILSSSSGTITGTVTIFGIVN